MEMRSGDSDSCPIAKRMRVEEPTNEALLEQLREFQVLDEIEGEDDSENGTNAIYVFGVIKL